MESGNQFLFEVKAMREAQKSFVSGKTKKLEKIAKNAESRVDEFLKEYVKIYEIKKEYGRSTNSRTD